MSSNYVVRDTLPSKTPTIGRLVHGHVQQDAYSCGAAAAFTALCARSLNRKGYMPAVEEYANVWNIVRPSEEWGSELPHINRVLRARYGRLRKPEVVKNIRDGNVVIAAVAWPSDEEPDMLHYVVISGQRGDKFFVTNQVRSDPNRSWGWQTWEWIRPGALDSTLVYAL